MLATLVSALSLVSRGRQLSFSQLLAYSPGSQVTSHASERSSRNPLAPSTPYATPYRLLTPHPPPLPHLPSDIDLDQSAIAARLSASYDYAGAQDIYENGGHSKPEATCTFSSPAALVADVADKTSVSFTTEAGDSATATVNGGASAGAVEIDLHYFVSEERVAPDGTTCFTGGLRVADQATGGCIVGSASAGGSSTITISGAVYTAVCVNSAGRTLQGFSTAAQSKMYDCSSDATKDYPNGCPYSTCARPLPPPPPQPRPQPWNQPLSLSLRPPSQV